MIGLRSVGQDERNSIDLKNRFQNRPSTTRALTFEASSDIS